MAITVTLYTSATCPYCDELKEYLEEKRLPFNEVRVDLMPDAGRYVARLVGDEVVPVTVIDRTGRSPVPVVGFDRQKLDAILEDRL
jgi:glutaredoxin